MSENFIFMIGLILFFSALIFFLAFKRKNSKIAMINMMICFVTLLSYAVLSKGWGTVSSSGSELIYPTRWLFYILSCSLLMWEIALILKKNKKQMMQMILLNSFVMLAGYFASIFTGLFGWLFFVLSSVAFVLNLLIILSGYKKYNKFMKFIVFYVLIFWTLFPVVWLLAPTGAQIFAAGLTALLYLILDLITKIVFGAITVFKKKI